MLKGVSPRLRLLIATVALLGPHTAHAESMVDPQLVPVALSLLLVVILIFAVGYVMRRINFAGGGSKQMRVVSSLMVGTRERVAVIQVGEEQHLVGITAQNINHLGRLESPIENDAAGQFDMPFAKLLGAKMSANSDIQAAENKTRK